MGRTKGSASGPMSQDFMAAFGLGDDDSRINLIDANGVNMVAI
jgi:trimeric autotransporter adhesin